MAIVLLRFYGNRNCDPAHLVVCSVTSGHNPLACWHNGRTQAIKVRITSQSWRILSGQTSVVRMELQDSAHTVQYTVN